MGGHFHWGIEALPCRTEKMKEVVWTLVNEIITQFGLAKNLQSDNGSAFKATVTQEISSALGI